MSDDAGTLTPYPGMVRIPGGTFRMGSDHHYAEEKPAHTVTVSGFWIDETPVTNAQFRAFVEATGHVTWAEIDPDPKDYPGRAAGDAEGRRSCLHAALEARRSRRLEPVVALHLRGHVAAALRQGQSHRRARRSSGGADRLPRCRGLCQMGGQGTADGSRMGVRGARRIGWRRVRLGRRTHTGRPAHGQYLAGCLPAREYPRRRLCPHVARPRLSGERLRRIRHDRQRLGVDRRLVCRPAPGRCGQGLLRAGEPARRDARAELRPARRGAHPAPRC